MFKLIKSNLQADLLYAFFSFAFLCLSVIIFYPGWMSYDSIVQYSQAITGDYNSWHPVIMAWWWHILNYIIPGPSLFFMQNQICYWLGLYLIAVALHKHISYWAIFVLLFGFAPPLLLVTVQIWKDVVFSSLMILSLGIVFNTIENKKWNIIIGIIVLVLMSLACGSKTNGYPVAGIIIFWWVAKNPILNTRLKKIRFFSLSLIMVIAIPIAITSTLNVKKASPIQYIQSYDLLRISLSQGKVLLPEYFTRKVGINDSNMEQFLLPGHNQQLYYFTAGDMTSYDKNEINELQSVWVQAIKKYPLSYLDARLIDFKELLRIGFDYPGNVVGGKMDNNPWGFEFKAGELSNLYLETVSDYPVFYFPWVYLLISLLVFAMSFFIKSRVKEFSIIVGLCSLFFALPHFFIGPASDYRYLHFSIVCAAIQFCVFLGIVFRSEK